MGYTDSVQGRVANSVGIHFLWCSKPLVCDFVVAGDSVETWGGGSDSVVTMYIIVQAANFKLLWFGLLGSASAGCVAI